VDGEEDEDDDVDRTALTLAAPLDDDARAGGCAMDDARPTTHRAAVVDMSAFPRSHTHTRWFVARGVVMESTSRSILAKESKEVFATSSSSIFPSPS
jgi:hypothetical protein